MDRARSKEAVADQQSVRDRMRARAREQTGAEHGPYLTPEWLDHSFVLPAAVEAGGVSLPSPRGESPVAVETLDQEAPAAVFERPASPEIDFVAVMRRADIGRRARIVTAVALVAALVAAVVFQVTGQSAVAAIAILAVAVTLGAAATRVVLNRAPVPYRES
jgi:hypothetical protein